MSSPTIPTDIANRALDECGLPSIGDLDDGSDAAKAIQRIYWPTLRQILSAAYWNFARKQHQLVCLADAIMGTETYTDVPQPWGFMYEWPDDCVHARWVPATVVVETPGTPIFTGGQTLNVALGASRPTPFLVTSSNRTNDIASNWYSIEGHDPEQTKVILSNQYGAHLVYTGLMQYPDAWDALFEQAVVAALAARLAMPLIRDRKEARVIRSDNIMIAKDALVAARVRDGDEGWTVQNHMPDWIEARWGGAPFCSGLGVWLYPYMNIPWIEGSGGVY